MQYSVFFGWLCWLIVLFVLYVKLIVTLLLFGEGDSEQMEGACWVEWVGFFVGI
jgi:hypothetical protein